MSAPALLVLLRDGVTGSEQRRLVGYHHYHHYHHHYHLVGVEGGLRVRGGRHQRARREHREGVRQGAVTSKHPDCEPVLITSADLR